MLLKNYVNIRERKYVHISFVILFIDISYLYCIDWHTTDLTTVAIMWEQSVRSSVNNSDSLFSSTALR